VKLLFDENVSPKVAERIVKEDGIDACHVRDRGMLAATDREVLDRAFDEDRIVVTSNITDFLKLARARDIHAGIIMLPGSLPREEQLRLVRVAVTAIAKLDLANKVLSVGEDGSTIVEEIPPTASSQTGT
jgi:predicted nuclease of predicted toxin-antitoxin system